MNRFVWYALACVVVLLAVGMCVRGCRQDVAAGAGMTTSGEFPPPTEEE